MRIGLVMSVALALALGATGAQAQTGSFPGGGGFPGGRGGFPGGRGRMGHGGPRFGGGERLQVPDLGNPVRLILANKDTLKLGAEQVQKVDSVAQALDRQNQPLIALVRRAFGRDSASMASGRSAAADQGEGGDVALRDRLNVVRPTFKQIQKNEDKAWKSATALLNKKQRKQADRIRQAEQKARQQRRQQHWHRGGGGPQEGGF